MKTVRDYLLEIVLAIVSLTLLSLIIAPYWFGYTMQTEYEDMLRRFAASTDYRFEVVKYERHWFSTDAALLIKDDSGQSLANLKHQIVHGPVYFGLLLKGRSPWASMVIKANWQPADVHRPQLREMMSADQAVSLFMVMQHNGNAELNVNIPALKVNINSVVYQTAAITVSLNYRAADSHYIGQLKMPFLSTKNKRFLEADNAVLSFNQSRINNRFSGDAVLTLDALKLKINNQMFDIRQLSSRLINTLDTAGINLRSDLNVSRINLFNEQLNSLSVSSVVSGIKINPIGNLGFSAIEFDGVDIKPFSFFTEHGSCQAELSLNKMLNNPFSLSTGFQYNQPLFNLSVSVPLFKRIYSIVASMLSVSVTDSRLFLNKLIALDYLENNQGKIHLKLSNRDDKIVVNDHLVSFNELRRQFLSAVSLK
ncbi:MAG: YdgA family protein [Gammaproteobacteria bacterium]|nr:YdgA family protein [Gammaproteobacteria bacterium]